MLLQLLQEASTLSIEDLKKALKKDKSAGRILDKNLKLADIENADAFLSSLKFYIFNNDNVRAFVDRRHDIKEVSKLDFKDFRSLRSADLTDSVLEDIRDFIAIMFKEHAATERGTMSPELRKELVEWLNKSGRHYNLSSWAQKELMSIPSLRPEKRVLVYRGVLFSDYDLKTRESYDGTMSEGNGIKFLKSIKKGTAEVDLSWDRPSSWTTVKDTAVQFAKYGPASSQFSAMSQWLDREMQKKHIDGALGFVIAAFVKPEDILIDTSRIGSIKQQYGSESEIIVKPGAYNVRIIKKYTVHGEVDPTLDASAGLDINNILEKINTFTSKNPIDGFSDLIKIDGLWGSAHESVQLLKNMKVFKKLVLDGTTTAILHEYDKFLKFYHETLADIKTDELRADLFIGDTEMVKRAAQLKDLLTSLRSSTAHPKFKDAKGSKGPKADLTAEEFRVTINAYDLKDFEKDLLVTGRIRDRQSMMTLSRLGDTVDVDVASNFTQMGVAKQSPVIEAIFDKIIDKIGLTPGDKQQNIKRMLNLLLKAYRNHRMIAELSFYIELLEGKK